MNFSPSTYKQLKSRLKLRYKKNLSKLITQLKKQPDSEVAEWVNTHHDELLEYSSVKWHYLTQLQLFCFLASQAEDLGESAFGPEEEEVFEKWNNSEFADIFLKDLNKGFTLGKANRRSLLVLDKHLVTFGERHILRSDRTTKAYRSQSSLGDFTKNGKITRHLETTLHVEGKDLRLMTKSLKEMKDFSQRIELALEIIRTHSPTSWDRFSAFTDVIVPIKNPEFVSYSHQDLPGYSMINMYHRDFVDLIDDLLHENGHHHLNFYLNLEMLIEEPLDNIYYSPWRKTLRPLRGIFHAYFTFYWAFKLFSDLLTAPSPNTPHYSFSEDELEKIIWRAIEEYYLLTYSFDDLKWARKKRLIHEKGWQLIEEQQKELKKFAKKLPLLEKKIKIHRQDLRELKKTLHEARRVYAKN
jgi:hypothetical protein